MARGNASVGMTVDGDSSGLSTTMYADNDQLRLSLDGHGPYFSLRVTIQDRYGLGRWENSEALKELIENLELFTEGLKAYSDTLAKEVLIGRGRIQ